MPPDLRPLLAPLADATAALARLDATLALVGPEVAAGLCARIAYREAAGWLAQRGVWVHPLDLALRDGGLAGSYTAASRGRRLASVLPVTLEGGEAPVLPEDATAEQALLLARLWRRLVELPHWGRVETPEGMAALLHPLRGATLPETAIAAWRKACAAVADLPPLLRAAEAARAWQDAATEEGREERPARAALLLAAALWRAAGGGEMLPLPFWSAPVAMLHRLALAPAAGWAEGFLRCTAAAAEAAARELARLREAEWRLAALPCTARAKLPAAAAVALSAPLLTRRMLAERLGISPQAALALIDRLVAAGLLREATGRSFWRVFVLA
jgi:hypothetical protein